MIAKMETGSDLGLPAFPSMALWQTMDILGVVGHPSEGGVVGMGYLGDSSLRGGQRPGALYSLFLVVFPESCSFSSAHHSRASIELPVFRAEPSDGPRAACPQAAPSLISLPAPAGLA